MWSPTHIEVTVQRARGLLTKGKNGTNNCFVTISLGKEKYQTSVKEKAESNINWNEECELKIPDQGNRAELMLTCLHRNNLSIDEFLGQVTLPLNEMDVYERPRSKWYSLESKPGKEKKNKERGELEVRISFVVRSGSLTDLNKKDKHKTSIGQLASSVGGSLLSIGQIEKRKGIKKFAKSLGSKMHLHSKRKSSSKEGDDVSYGSGSFASIGTPTSSNGGSRRYGQRAGEADPGVISEDEDEFVFDNLSHKSSGSSLNLRSNVVGSVGGGGGGGVNGDGGVNGGVSGGGVNGGVNGGGGGGISSLQPSTGSGPLLPMTMPITLPLTSSSSTQNILPSNPSPLLAGGNIKTGGKQSPSREHRRHANGKGSMMGVHDSEFTALRARPLPPPSKPPRTQQAAVLSTSTATPASASASAVTPTLDEWEAKLYGATETLKRRSWETTRVPLTTIKDDERHDDDEQTNENENVMNDDSNNNNDNNNDHLHHQNQIKLKDASKDASKDVNAIMNGSKTEKESVAVLLLTEGGGSDREKSPHRWMAEGREADAAPSFVPTPTSTSMSTSTPTPMNNNNNNNNNNNAITTTLHLLTPEIESKDFHQFNASFAKFEQSNSAKIFLPDEEEEEEEEEEDEKKKKEKKETEAEEEVEDKQQQLMPKIEKEFLKKTMKEENINLVEMEKKREENNNHDNEALKSPQNFTKELDENVEETKESNAKNITEKKKNIVVDEEELLMKEAKVGRENVNFQAKMDLDSGKRVIPQEIRVPTKEQQQQQQQPLSDESITKVRGEVFRSKQESAAVTEASIRQRTTDIMGQRQYESPKKVEALKVSVKGFEESTPMQTKDSPKKVEALSMKMSRNEKEEVKKDDDDEINRRRRQQADMEAKRRDERRQEEDQRILNFAKRPLTLDESDDGGGFTTPPLASSPQQASGDKKEKKRLSKFKYFSMRDKLPNESRALSSSSSSSPKCTERIIIGHEKASTHAERRSEVTAALNKKYEGKSREELMVIANGMENEALIQRQRVKELEDYLDNLLLRVMETHPKILQNPYSRTSSTKCFKSFIGINDFP